MVAIKIIDIDSGDTINPRMQNTFADVLKEIQALKVLTESNAENINGIIEAIEVGTAIWMVTEYCAGGSVSTLLRPTPKGLKERFIRIIVREVAKALKHVHAAGIVHRDVKCANVLITEDGGVQLCDFGVAGMLENATDKRSTFIGTPHWMAPEMFDQSVKYGIEVDVWSLGAMAFEMATGVPPNAYSGVDPDDLGAFLKQNIPRLTGDQHSDGLRDLVAYCLEENPRKRPTIGEVLEHPYIRGTEEEYPTRMLTELVRAFKKWEAAGGSRRSLFQPGGAQGLSALDDDEDEDSGEWNFSTTAAFDRDVTEMTSNDDVRDVYGNSVDLSAVEETAKPVHQNGRSRRRPPPSAMAAIKAPIEKLFDPNTLTGYEDRSRVHYMRGLPMSAPAPPGPDLPFRKQQEESGASTRESIIDLGDMGDFGDSTASSFSFGGDLTIRPAASETTFDYGDSPAPASDAVENPNRRTQDWTFPSSKAATAAKPAQPRRVPTEAEPSRPPFRLGGGRRPSLIHAATEPVGAPFKFHETPEPESPQILTRPDSLIDLDFSMPEPSSGPQFAFGAGPTPDFTPNSSRPATAMSTHSIGTSSSESGMARNPFELENKGYGAYPAEQGHRPREPSLYISDDNPSLRHFRKQSNISDVATDSDFASGSEAGQFRPLSKARHTVQLSQNFSDLSDSDHPFSAPSNRSRRPLRQMSGYSHQVTVSRSRGVDMDDTTLPPLPTPPSQRVMSGLADSEETASEMQRILEGFGDQLEGFISAAKKVKPTPSGGARNSRDSAKSETGDKDVN